MSEKAYTVEEIKQKLMHYCAYQDRCHWEVEQKLNTFFLIPEARDEILFFLLREKYLDEERFTRSYIRGKFLQKHWGRVKIRQHLRMKQVPDKLIERCWDEIEEESYRERVIIEYEKYLSAASGKNSFEKHKKTQKYLFGKGFEWELIQEAAAHFREGE